MFRYIITLDNFHYDNFRIRGTFSQMEAGGYHRRHGSTFYRMSANPRSTPHLESSAEAVRRGDNRCFCRNDNAPTRLDSIHNASGHRSYWYQYTWKDDARGLCTRRSPSSEGISHRREDTERHDGGGEADSASSLDPSRACPPGWSWTRPHRRGEDG